MTTPHVDTATRKAPEPMLYAFWSPSIGTWVSCAHGVLTGSRADLEAEHLDGYVVKPFVPRGEKTIGWLFFIEGVLGT